MAMIAAKYCSTSKDGNQATTAAAKEVHVAQVLKVIAISGVEVVQAALAVEGRIHQAVNHRRGCAPRGGGSL